ncbi:unnamed protein product [Prunus armeniaca]|uniref:Uncharacterized protein n=1 Tax=Prunus armeniaca TaxID=36596 RepID=A0A6J5V1X4_PRUAR|nr:unnamed protein product [Prunus armeniaca]
MLDLSNNEPQVIPDSIARLEKLEEINLSSNLLEALPYSIEMLQNLSWSIWIAAEDGGAGAGFRVGVGDG